MKFILIAILFSFTFSHSTNQLFKQKDISEMEAIKLAEEFIKVNGYTKYPADTSKLSYEFLYDSEESVKSILKKRHNSLQPKAFCVFKNDDRWNIGFVSSKINLSKLDSAQINGNLTGKSVTMNLDGSEIRMAHKDPLFSKWRKLLN